VRFLKYPVKKTFISLTIALLYSNIVHAADVVISTNTVGGQNFFSGTNTIQVNSGVSLSASSQNAIYVGGGTLSILNKGTISTDYYVIQNQGTISSLVNEGEITGPNGILNIGTIDTVTNLGTIGGPGILNFVMMSSPIITNLNNAQGGLNPLLLQGRLPLNYNIITGASSYGKFSVTSASGNMAFGISPLSGLNIGIAGTRYANVIAGVNASLISNELTMLSYTSGGKVATYELIAGTGADIWDLSILTSNFGASGPTLYDTQASVQASAQKLRSIFNASAISSNFANMNTYDCNLFDAKNMCISVGGRFTTVDNPNSNSTSAVVVVGYKVIPNIRIGGFLDQSINNSTPSGIKVSNKDPLMGAFIVWNQKTDGLGYQVKLANAYQDKDVDITREVISTSEAGRGETSLNTQSYVGELSYAFNYNNKTLLRPYLALRHTTIKQDAYTETDVSAPLSYAALVDRSTTALLGLKINHELTPRTTLTSSLGLEQDLEHHVNQYSASATDLSGLTSENFSDNIKRTRPVASAGAYFAVSKTQRIAGDVYYQQLSFQRTASTTAYFNYTIGF
jgi:hypothetical protein